MTAVRKFLFERSFDAVEEPEEEVKEEAEEAPEPEEEVPSFSEEEMQAARDEAFAAGKEEGVREAAGTTESRIQETLTRLTDRFVELFQAQENDSASMVETAVSVAVSIARKVFPALNERNALGEIERMAVMAMEKILEEPRVVIYVNPELAPPLSERLETLAAQAGYKGRVEVTPVDDISLGDCRVEWSGGGATRDTAEMWQEIDEIVERNLAGDEDDQAIDADAEPETPETPEAVEEEASPDAPEAPEPADGKVEPDTPEPGETAAEKAAPDTPEAPEAADAETAGDEPAATGAEPETDAEPEGAADTPDVDPSPEDAILDGTSAADVPADTADDTLSDETPAPTDSADETPAEEPADEPAEEPLADEQAVGEPEPPEEAPDAPGDDDTETDREEP